MAVREQLDYPTSHQTVSNNTIDEEIMPLAFSNRSKYR